MPDYYTKQWEKIDKLLKKGLPQSAAEIAGKILQRAVADKNSVHAIKAQLFLIEKEQSTGDHTAFKSIYDVIEISEATPPGVDKAIWQSLAAEMMWAYYRDNRYTILKRTSVADPDPQAMETWDAATFFHEISMKYLASLEPVSELKKTPVTRYAALVESGVHTEQLRPTMYDLLVFRAIRFFDDDEKDLTRPAYHFEIKETAAFLPAQQFVKQEFSSPDSTSLHLRALKLYQQVLAFHLADKQPDALIDADLNRLKFVHERSVRPDKDSLYLAALTHLSKLFPDNAATAEIWFRVLSLQYEHLTDTGNRHVADRPDDAIGATTIPEIAARLEEVSRRFPQSEGAVHATQLLAIIHAKTINLQAEEVALPEAHIKVRVGYQNVSKVYLKLYRRPSGPILSTESDRSQTIAELAGLTPLKTWDQQLPASSDMRDHSVEIDAGSLPAGSYLLVASLKEGLAEDTNIVESVSFQVSSLAMISRTEYKGLNSSDANDYWVVDRKTGRLRPGVDVKVWRSHYDRDQRKYVWEKFRDLKSDEQGKFNISVGKDRSDFSITLIDQGDTLQTGHRSLYTWRPRSSDEARTHTFFFTDRSIYRPGQTIYYKGIVVMSNGNAAQTAVREGYKTTVAFLDVNGQTVGEQEVTTNEFGSFSGSFIAPEGGLTGLMRLSEKHGRVPISVEAYKRPKFFVKFDTVAKGYRLGQTVQLQGRAEAYAGNSVDGATVQYRIVRRTVFPFPWAYFRYMPGRARAAEMEIGHGSTETRPDGTFDIQFEAVPDLTIDPKSMPVFDFVVYADVTDQNGETRSSQTIVNVGYVSLTLHSSLPETAKPDDLDAVTLQTRNLNGTFTRAEVTLRVAPLVFPGKIYRERLWPEPDQQVLSEAEFRRAFPDDEYRRESDYRYWKEGTPVYEKTFVNESGTSVAVPPKEFSKSGWYLFEWRARDDQGNEVVEKDYCYVWRPGSNDPVQKSLFVYTNRDSVQPGEQLNLWLATGFENIHLFDATSTDGSFAAPGSHVVRVKEEDRGGLYFFWFFIENNRQYAAEKYVAVPWRNKQLKLTWATHRDRLLPGAEETWRITVTGPEKDRVAAELVAGLYDASLDAFRTHVWNPSLFTESSGYRVAWTAAGFDNVSSRNLSALPIVSIPAFEKSYPDFERWMPVSLKHITDRMYLMASVSGEKDNVLHEQNVPSPPPGSPQADSSEASPVEPVQTEVSFRENLNETAFFFPHLVTDAQGNVAIEFTMPEALTEWRFMAFAHTPDWKTGYLEGAVKTQKKLMVVPNLPRFLRQGDAIEISAKISNLTKESLEGSATIEILNALTMQPLDLPFRLEKKQQPFVAEAWQSTAVSWKLHVPESIYTPVTVRVFASAADFSDGESNMVPVVTNRTLVTETMPLSIRGNGSRQFTFDKLANAKSGSLVHQGLTVEFTSNPAWYAVQALPYLMTYPYDCAEQVFNRFYANSIAAHIVSESPRIEKIFDEWEAKETTALASNLEKNQELKSALLEETPWVFDAQSETAQQKRVAVLFQTHQMAKRLKSSLHQLEELQLADGYFPWFKGMLPNRYITQYILSGVGRLQHLGVTSADNRQVRQIVERALPQLDAAIKEDYERILAQEKDRNKRPLSYVQIQYLYLRSFFPDLPVDAGAEKAVAYFRDQAVRYWPEFNPYMKGMLALAFSRSGNSETAGQIMKSLREYAIHDDEMGMYWKNMPHGYRWYEAPLEAQALLIEAFSEVANDDKAVDAMKIWLLKQKQTQRWESTKATADACYALLLNGTDWLQQDPEVTVRLGDVSLRSDDMDTEAGTGYFKKRIAGNDVTPEMGEISVTVGREADEGTAWGAVYWQYFEDMDKVTNAATPLRLQKQLFLVQASDRGPQLTAITETNTLSVGDKVRARILLHVDRDMEFVHLKDMRAACFEPVNVLSGYRYKGGLGYYESTQDLSSNFFFDNLPKGDYVFEYEMIVGQKGDFSNGIATIQCLYAPSFSSHSNGIRVTVD